MYRLCWITVTVIDINPTQKVLKFAPKGWSITRRALTSCHCCSQDSKFQDQSKTKYFKTQA